MGLAEKFSFLVYFSNLGLKEYKRQHTVENKFKFIKNPVLIGPIYLQKKERLEALTYVVIIALLIYSILERRVRQALKKED